ncbi:hypothetical protein AB0E27_31280 [Streptomyces sparsogenes]|uniref:hypothetical protein n=1 Tax=Streptomyces sparsogenes TaxID=67365 RepID=UPI00340E428C
MSNETKSLRESVRELIAEHRAAEAERQGYLDKLVEGGDREGSHFYEMQVAENETEAAGALRALLADLAELVAPVFKVGDRVTVAADAKTAQGGRVYFSGEVIGTVIGELDSLGDVEVESAGAVIPQYVAPRFLKRAND